MPRPTPDVTIYACPLCSAPLAPDASGYCCPARHRFDLAKEGYVNLMPVQHKHSLDPGDNAEMLAARRDFLEQGHYAPLRAAIGRALSQAPPGRLLDIGAGEGWYSGGLQPELPGTEVHGIDISKHAMRLAARRYPACRFAVASSRRPPFGPASFSHLLNVFAPLDLPAATRLLVPGGQLLRVSPAPNHLFEIKALLYDRPRPHSESAFAAPGFTLCGSERIQHRFTIQSRETLETLIKMTPFGWKLDGCNSHRLAEAAPLELSLDVWLEIYRLPASGG